MANQPHHETDGPSRTNLLPMNANERLDLRTKWNGWKDAWAKCEQERGTANYAEFEASCERAQKDYRDAIEKFERRP